MTVKERFDFLINHYAKGNKRAFSSMIEVSPSVVENIVGTRGGNPSFEVLQKILYAFEHINPKWLIAGQGETFMEEKYSDLPKGIDKDKIIKINTSKQIERARNKTKGFPLIPVEAMMGYGNGDVQVMDYDIQEDYLITPELENKGIKYLIRASGSSMTPKYNNGDLLACRPITDISFIQWGKVYVLDTDQGPLVKRLYPCNPTDDDCLECRSDNYEKYLPFKIRKESIRRIAIVVAVLRLE